MQWISVNEKMPPGFVSVLVYMPSEEPFPTVREGYTVGGAKFYIPALKDMRTVTHWAWMPKGADE